MPFPNLLHKDSLRAFKWQQFLQRKHIFGGMFSLQARFLRGFGIIVGIISGTSWLKTTDPELRHVSQELVVAVATLL